jgi:hypothetical protein
MLVFNLHFSLPNPVYILITKLKRPTTKTAVVKTFPLEAIIS